MEKAWGVSVDNIKITSSVIQDLLRNNIPTQSIQTTLDSDLSNLKVTPIPILPILQYNSHYIF